MYIREMLEVGASRVAWDRGILIKRGVDPDKFMRLNYGSRPYEYLIFDHRGILHVDQDTTQTNPKAAYPLWDYRYHSTDVLRDLLQGNTKLAGGDEFTSKPGQRSMFGIAGMATGRTVSGKKFHVDMAEAIQATGAEVHVHGLYGTELMFGLEYVSCDAEPREYAAKGKIILPTGKRIAYDDIDLAENKHWVELLGFTVKDMLAPRYRCMFNIESYRWMARNFKDVKKVRFKDLDPFEDIQKDKPRESSKIFLKRVKPLDNDKFYCNICSLQSSCRYFQQGAVCVVPDSEPRQLAQFFKTRDADSIISGLQGVMEIEVQRMRDARQDEIEKENINPEVTKMLNNIFSHGEKLAKLVDPSLRPGPGRPALPGVTAGETPQESASKVMELLNNSGIPSSAITPELVMGILEAPGDNLAIKVENAAALIRKELSA